MAGRWTNAGLCQSKERQTMQIRDILDILDIFRIYIVGILDCLATDSDSTAIFLKSA